MPEKETALAVMTTQTDYLVPFFQNTADDTHCAQATVRMIRKYFEPQLDFTWDELDRGTGKTGLHATWRMAGLIWLQSEGYDVQVIETLDYAAFAHAGVAYLSKVYTPEAVEFEMIWTDLPLERERAKTFTDLVSIQKRSPTQADIEQFLLQGYLVQVTLNRNRLNGWPGYHGHAVLVKGYDASSFIGHDPGLPAIPNRVIDRETFEASWTDRHLVAVRKNSTNWSDQAPLIDRSEGSANSHEAIAH